MAVDHCTLWPDQAFGVDYSACCFDHDNSALDLASHLDLGGCVAALGLPLWGALMTIGVIVFGPLYGLWRRRSAQNPDLSQPGPRAGLFHAWSPTMTAKFKRSHDVTAKWEGGWSNHKADPGGKTMLGVTEKVFHAWLKANGKPIRPVRTIALTEALAIYFDHYWTPIGGERLVAGVDLAAYDTAVNSGVSRARKLLVAGLDPKDRHDQTVRNICAKRMSFLRALTHWKSFGKGWTNRVSDIEAKGVAWALTAMRTPSNVPVPTPRPTIVRDVADRLETEARTADNQAKTQKAGSVASGGGAGASGAAGTQTVDPSVLPTWSVALMIAIVAVLVIVAIVLAYRSRVNGSRALAYRNTVQELDAHDVV